MNKTEVAELPLECVRVLSVDPSTQHMGIAVADVNLKKPSKFKLHYANTLHGEKLSFFADVNHDDNGKVQSRIKGLSKGIGQLLDVYDPTIVICEDNFLGASPDTFKRLVEAVDILREEVSRYSPTLFFYTVTPNAAKEIVGANFRGTQKEDVQKGLRNYKRLDLNGHCIDNFDEHTTDAVAINLYMCETIAKDRGVFLDV